MTELSLHATKVMMEGDAENGCLVYANGELAAVLVRLDGDYYQEDRDSWNLEVGFGPCAEQELPPFTTLRGAFSWIAERVNAPSSSIDALLEAIKTESSLQLHASEARR